MKTIINDKSRQKDIYILDPFDKDKGIMTDTRGAFATVDALLEFLERQGKVSDEFCRITDRDDLKEYIIGGYATLRVEIPDEELMSLITIKGTVEYYHVSIVTLYE